MINVLFVSVRWYTNDKNTNTSFLSEAYHNFYSSLNSTGLAQYKLFEYDYQKEMGIDTDKSLIEMCKHNKFDVIIFANYSAEYYFKFSDATWSYLHSLDIPMVITIGDYYPDRESYNYLKHADLVIYCDTDEEIGKTGQLNYFYLAHPLDPGIFYNSDLVRDTPIIFAGSASSVERIDLVKYLRSMNLPIKVRGGRIDAIWGRYHIASNTEYAIDQMRSKISICLTHEYREDRIVAHIHESMQCGCCTFINKAELVRRYFTPDVHYVEYTDKYDLADKLIYYMDNEDEAQEIANNGYNEVQKYSVYNFYNDIFLNLSKVCKNFVYKNN